MVFTRFAGLPCMDSPAIFAAMRALSFKSPCAAIMVALVLGVFSSTASASADLSPRRLVEMTDISGVAVSPDGRMVVFREETPSIEQNVTRAAWYVADIDSEDPPLRIGDGGVVLHDGAGGVISETPQWSPDSRWIYFRAFIDGEIQVWRASTDGDRMEAITNDGADVESFRLSRDGRSLLYETGPSRAEIRRAERAEYDQGIRFDNTTDGAQNLFRAFPINGQLSSHRFINGYVKGLRSSQARAFHKITLGVDRNFEISEKEYARLSQARDADSLGASGLRQSSSSPDGKRRAVLAGAYPRSALTVENMGGSRRTTCVQCQSMTIEAFAWRNDDEIVFTARDPSKGFAQSLYAWSIKENAVRLIISSEGLLSADRRGAGSTCAIGVQYAFCIVQSAATPPRLEKINIESGERAIIADPNRRLALDVKEKLTVQLAQWRDGDEHLFTGHLFLPRRRQNAPMPLFISYYRCPGFIRGGYGDEWPFVSLATAGIAALCINAPSPRQADAVSDYEIARSGVEAVISSLAERGLIDRTRVGMGGFSFGSEAAMWIAGHSDLLTSVSIASAQLSPTSWWFRSLLSGRAESMSQRWGIASPEETPAQWRRISPAHFADDINATVLMQIPEGEYRQELELYVRLRRRGVPTEFYVFPNETHQKQEPRHKLAIYERNLAWFRFWLRGETDEDGDRTHYQRWKDLRSDQRPSDRG
ncbi:MAG: Atxe2 family lasso peptide isopeptidase [Parvularculaceae bacterium]